MLGRTPKKSSAAMCGTSRDSTREVHAQNNPYKLKSVKS